MGMSSGVIRFAQRCARRVGVELRRAHPDALEVQRQLVRGDAPVIFDVGAHVGAAADQYLQVFPGARIHCFEPYSQSATILRQRFASEPRVSVHETAVAAGAGTARLSINAYDATNSLLSSAPDADRNWGVDYFTTTDVVPVLTTSIDGFCEQHGISEIDLLKVDVQGSEYDVLQGAREMLSRQAVRLLYFELIVAPTYSGQRAAGDYLSMLEAVRYELLDIYDVRKKGLRLMQMDVICLPESVMSTL